MVSSTTGISFVSLPNHIFSKNEPAFLMNGKLGESSFMLSAKQGKLWRVFESTAYASTIENKERRIYISRWKNPEGLNRQNEGQQPKRKYSSSNISENEKEFDPEENRIRHRLIGVTVNIVRETEELEKIEKFLSVKCHRLLVLDFARVILKQKTFQKARIVYDWLIKENKLNDLKETVEVYGNLFRHFTWMGECSEEKLFLKQVEMNRSPEEFNLTSEIAIKHCLYAQNWDMAVSIFDQMVSAGVSPSRDTFLNLSKALQKADSPLSLLSHLERVLVHMNTLGLKEPIPFNCLLQMYVKVRQPGKALSLLQEMEQRGIPMDLFSFHSAMQSFGLQGNVNAAKGLVEWLCKHHELKPTLHTFSILLRILGEAQRMREALAMADRMRAMGLKGDSLFFNTLICYLGKAKMASEAYVVYQQMLSQGPAPDLHTFKQLLLATAASRKLLHLPAIMEDLFSSLSRPSEEEGSQEIPQAILRACSACLMARPPDAELAESILCQLASSWGWVPTAAHMDCILIGYRKESPLPPTVLNTCRALVAGGQVLSATSWNALIGYHFFRGHLTELLSAVEGMRATGQEPSREILCMVADLHGTHGDVAQAEEAIREMKRRGMNLDIVAYVVLLNAYSEMGLPERARSLFADMASAGVRPDCKCWTLLIKAWGRAGDTEQAVQVYRNMVKARVRMDEIAYNTVLNVCGPGLPLEETIEIYERMRRDGLRPNEVTENILLSLLTKGDRLAEASELFKRMVRSRRACCVSFSTMVDALGKRGQLDAMALVLEEAREKLRGQLAPSVYNAAMESYGSCGMFREMEKVLESMEGDGVKPDLVSFNTLIHTYGSNNRMVEMEETLHVMDNYEVEKDMWTYNILIGSYAAMNMPHASMKIFREMQDAGLNPDEYTYSNVIRAFRLAGDELEAARWTLWMKQAGFDTETWKVAG